MEKKTPKTTGGKRTALTVVLALAAVAVLLLLLYTSFSYRPLCLLALSLMPPVLLSLFLLLPIGNAAEDAAPAAGAEEAPPTGKRAQFRRRFAAWRARRALACRSFYAKRRDTLLVVLSLVALIALSVFFFLQCKLNAPSARFGYTLPVALLGVFLILTVLEKWCKHTATALSGEGAAPEALYAACILRTLRSAAVLAKISTALVAVATVVRLLAPYNPTRITMVLLAVLYCYQALFLLIALAVRFIRRELSTAPDLSVPIFGVGGADLGLLSYLEKNTGITMRSLWSMRLIKSVIPYAFIAALLILWGTSGVVQIDASEQGAHYRLGKLADEPLTAGLHFTLPWPFDRVEVYETGKVQQLSVGYISDDSMDNLWTAEHGVEEHRLLLGGGEELVSVNLRVEYKIGDLKTYLKSSAAPEAILQAMAYEALTMKTIGTDLNTLLSTDRVAFAKDMRDELRAGAAERALGLEVVGVVLESIHPPVEIADIYQKLLRAGVDAERIKLLANATAEEKLITAQTGKATLIGQATADKEYAIAKAYGSVAEFLAAAEADKLYPTYRYEKYLAAITDAYGNATIVLVGDGVNKENIYIGNLSQ